VNTTKQTKEQLLIALGAASDAYNATRDSYYAAREALDAAYNTHEAAVASAYNIYNAKEGAPK